MEATPVIDNHILNESILIDGSALSISWKDQGTDTMLMHVVWNSQLYVETFPKCDSPAIKQAQKQIVTAQVHRDTILMYNVDGDEITAYIPTKEIIVRNLRDFNVEVVHGVMYLRGSGDYLYGRIELDSNMMQKLRELMVQAIMEPVCNDTLIVTHNDRQHHLGVVQNPQ